MYRSVLVYVVITTGPRNQTMGVEMTEVHKPLKEFQVTTPDHTAIKLTTPTSECLNATHKRRHSLKRSKRYCRAQELCVSQEHSAMNDISSSSKRKRKRRNTIETDNGDSSHSRPSNHCNEGCHAMLSCEASCDGNDQSHIEYSEQVDHLEEVSDYSRRLSIELKKRDCARKRSEIYSRKSRALFLHVKIGDESVKLTALKFVMPSTCPMVELAEEEDLSPAKTSNGETAQQYSQTNRRVQTNIGSLKKGECLYVMHERNKWFKVRLKKIKGNKGKVKYCKCKRKCHVVFMENGFAMSSDERAVSKWTFTTLGKRNVGVNLVKQRVVLSSDCRQPLEGHVASFDTETGVTELRVGEKRMKLIFKDNGTAASYDNTQTWSWILAKRKSVVGAKYVGKVISVELEKDRWVHGKVDSFHGSTEAYIISFSKKKSQKFAFLSNEIIRRTDGQAVYKWRTESSKGPSSELPKTVPLARSNSDHLSLGSAKNAFAHAVKIPKQEVVKVEYARPRRFIESQLVRVEPRCWPGVDFEGGVGRIKDIHSDGTYSVRFHVGQKRLEKHVDACYISEYDMFGEAENAVSEHMALCESSGFRIDESILTNTRTAQQEKSNTSKEVMPVSFVRRSVRRPGMEQLRRSGVRDLLSRLRENDPSHKDLRVLRLKNYLEADTNKIVLLEVLKLLERSTVVQVLYIHNFNVGMDDTVLKSLAGVLKENPMIWAVNVGENFGVTQKGWKRFCEALESTHVTHLYAGSESTVHGELKVEMRNAIRKNRKKHELHISPENLEVILQIGQMWWNPKNAKALRPFIDFDLLCHA